MLKEIKIEQNTVEPDCVGAVGDIEMDVAVTDYFN